MDGYGKVSEMNIEIHDPTLSRWQCPSDKSKTFLLKWCEKSGDINKYIIACSCRTKKWDNVNVQNKRLVAYS